MTPARYDLIPFLTDARIEAASPRGWAPDPDEAARAIDELEAALVDRDRLAAVVRRLRAAVPPPPPSDLTDEEFDGLMTEGLQGLYAAAVPRFLEVVADPVQLMLLREAVLDEMPAHWRAVVRRSQPVSIADPPPPRRRPALAPLDRSGGTDRWVVEVPADEVAWTEPDGGGSIAFELEFRPGTPAAKLAVKLIDPAPLPASRCRATVSDENLRECGRYDGPAEGVEVPLTDWDGHGPLYLTCEVQLTKEGRYEFVVPVRPV